MCVQVERFCDLHLPSGWADRPATAAVELASTLEPGLTAASAVAAPGNVSSGARVCTVYLATDEPAVIEEARERYKHIRFIINPGGAAMGA